MSAANICYGTGEHEPERPDATFPRLPPVTRELHKIRFVDIETTVYRAILVEIGVYNISFARFFAAGVRG